MKANSPGSRGLEIAESFRTSIHTAIGPVWAITGALIISGFLIFGVGASPVTAFIALFDGAFGNMNSIGVTIARTTPLLLAGLGVAIAFRCGVFNLGAEGQLYIGAIAAAWVGLAFQGLSSWLHIPLALAAAFLAGGIWGGIAAWLKATRGVNEIITTILMNYIGMYFASYLVNGPWKEPGFYPQSYPVAESAQLPIVNQEGRIHIGIFIALFSAVALYFLLWKTPLGYRIRAVGANAIAARHAHMNVTSNFVLAMLIGGGLAGLAGAVETVGVFYKLRDFFSPGYGYDAIAVALLGRNDPFGVVLAAFFFGVLRSGGNSMQRTTGVPSSLVLIIQGLAVLFVIASVGLNLRSTFRKRKETLRVADVPH